MNQAYQKLMKDLDGGTKSTLRHIECAWISSRDKKLGVYRELDQGTVVIPQGAYCTLIESGREFSVHS